MGCTKSLHDKLVPASRAKTIQNPYGAYIELSSSQLMYYGELLAISKDSLYVLTQLEFKSLSLDDVKKFKLILTRNRKREYGLATGLATVPSLVGAIVNPDYSGEFLTFTLITGISGGLATFIESERKSHELNFPADSSDISSFAKYARFPIDIPPNFNPIPYGIKQ